MLLQTTTIATRRGLYFYAQTMFWMFSFPVFFTTHSCSISDRCFPWMSRPLYSDDTFTGCQSFLISVEVMKFIANNQSCHRQFPIAQKQYNSKCVLLFNNGKFQWNLELKWTWTTHITLVSETEEGKTKETIIDKWLYRFQFYWQRSVVAEARSLINVRRFANETHTPTNRLRSCGCKIR